MADKAIDATKAAKKTSKISSITDNIRSVAKKYNLNENGFFGAKGKNTRIFKSKDPIKSSADFYKKSVEAERKEFYLTKREFKQNFPTNQVLCIGL